MTADPHRQRPVGLKRRLQGWLRRLPAPVWALALIYGIGGLMCLFAAVFPISKTAPTTLATVLGILLILMSLGLLRFGVRLSTRGLQVAALAGTIFNSILVANCTTDYGGALNSFAYLWIGIYAGQFFEPRAARFQAAALVVASGVALWLSGLPGMVTAWSLVAGSSVLATESLARLNSRLRLQLVTDSLTGLLNRPGFVAAAERMRSVADRAGLPISIALIDLDQFKQVNDLQGHAAGDELLVELGRGAWAWPSGGAANRSTGRWPAPTRSSTGPSATRARCAGQPRWSPELPSSYDGPPAQRQRRLAESRRDRAAAGRDGDLEAPGRGAGEGPRGECRR